jgi:FkbM family methyltransferase
MAIRGPSLTAARAMASGVRRTLAEKIGYGKYSYVALNGLDQKLERYLDKDGGFFVEAGANDGLSQSNTYYFEKIRKWTGVLVEPIPDLAKRCATRRSKSTVINAALVSAEFGGSDIEINYAGLMSAVQGAFADEELTNRHVADGLCIQGIERSYKIRVPALTLTTILDQIRPRQAIDLLSLDIEGYEPDALKGLDFHKYRPRFLCIEVRDSAAINKVLSGYYREIEVLFKCEVYQDILYQSTTYDV